jgi:hypothetical protein
MGEDKVLSNLTLGKCENVEGERSRNELRKKLQQKGLSIGRRRGLASAIKSNFNFNASSHYRIA